MHILRATATMSPLKLLMQRWQMSPPYFSRRLVRMGPVLCHSLVQASYNTISAPTSLPRYAGRKGKKLPGTLEPGVTTRWPRDDSIPRIVEKLGLVTPARHRVVSTEGDKLASVAPGRRFATAKSS